MAEYVWWFLIVGLVIGGAVVAVISIDFSRRAEDVAADELEAEATLLASQLRAEGLATDAATVAEILRADRRYRRLPPPDHLEPASAEADAASAEPGSAADGEPDHEPDGIGDGRGGGADEDLTPA